MAAMHAFYGIRNLDYEGRQVGRQSPRRAPAVSVSLTQVVPRDFGAIKWR